MANETEAPTSGATDAVLEEYKKQPKLTAEQHDFVLLIEIHYRKHSGFPSSERFNNDYGMPYEDFERLLKVDLVRTALSERGIEIPRTMQDLLDGTLPVGTSTDWRKSVNLTPHQILVANTMTDIIDTRSDKKKLQDLKVSTRQYNAWLSDPAFSGYLRELTEGMLTNNTHEAHLALLDKVRSGDVGAIKYWNELTGRYVEKSKRDADGADSVIYDLKQLMVQIVEIVIDEVDDPETAVRIGDRLNSLMGARQVVGALTGDSPEIIQPTVAPNRVITPELQNLMDHGAGMDD